MAPAKPPAQSPIESPALRGIEGSFVVGGSTCAVGRLALSGTHSSDLLAPRHHFVSFRGLARADYLFADGSFDGNPRVARRLSERDSFFLPLGTHWIGKARGSVNARVLVCDLEPSAFANALGNDVGHVDLEPRVGVNPVSPGILERLEDLCLSREAVPRAYADALTTVLAYELFRAYGAKPYSPPRSAIGGASRFKPVLDRIEETLANDTGLSELAALAGLSVSHFAHAFRAAYGVAPHRYILQRRIEEAKVLLRRSDATVASVSARVGFSSQSRFTQTFARQTGFTPSAYRLEHSR